MPFTRSVPLTGVTPPGVSRIDVHAAGTRAQASPGFARNAQIPPGPGSEETLEHDFAADALAYGVTYEIQGVTPDGLQARGTLTLLRPSPRPSRENAVPVSDPAMVQKIRRAMAILKQETVSQEDLWRLEREGKLE